MTYAHQTLLGSYHCQRLLRLRDIWRRCGVRRMPRTPLSSRDNSPRRPSPIDVTPVHCRSRRLQGLSPEMANNREERPQPSPVIFQRPRDPPFFHGFPQEDADDWLEQFERVAAFNRWSAEQKLNHVFFALEDWARTWFENQERLLITWDSFTARFLQSFSTVLRKKRAELLLQTRLQHPNETVVVFVEEMKRLFRRADPDMTEDKKLRILIRGVKEQLFAGVVRNPPKTIAEFFAEASTIERTLIDMRTRQYDRQVPAISANYGETRGVDAQTLRDTVRIVVREELRKLFPTTQQPQVSSLPEVIREELQQEIWRTPDHRPLCFHCGKAGHVYRFCPYRRLGLRGFSGDAPRPRVGERPQEIQHY
ncbi:uncharacterized protein LOC120849220, partial [Ixodes scapularis]|uniref:uncharacterized protein LOC120849220 n=1 Tax=Ixodes scapularis TaxID=6945 RepID=UPI001C388655